MSWLEKLGDAGAVLTVAAVAGWWVRRQLQVEQPPGPRLQIEGPHWTRWRLP